MKRIAILTALYEEGGLIEENFGKPLKTDLYGDFSIKTYAYLNKEIYFCNSGVGEISAAACTQLLITLYNPDVIFNYGFAGGYKDYKIGDAVLIKGVVHYDFDTSAVDDCERGRYLGKFDGPVIPTDEDFLNFVKKIDENIKVGILCSGDKFITDEAFKKDLYEEFGGTVYDMEGAAVVIISKNSKVPQIVVKVISDSGNADEYYAFKDLLSDTKVKFVNLIKEIVEKL